MAILFVIDVSQTKDAVRRNYPVVGRFRYLFSTLGEFFRQYFFAMDREEMPFNRAEREWIDHAAKGKDNTVAFGSTKSLTPSGTVIFSNCPFPTLDEDAAVTQPIEIEPYCKKPYTAKSLFNISGMSYGSLSAPAVRALSRGAKIAGCWMNTGEDSISPNRHPEINSIDDILDFVEKVRSLTGKPTGFKTVLGGYDWVETLCEKIHERGIESAPDFITLDSGDGGTGAAPMPLMDNVGLPIKLSLPMLSDVLHKYGLRQRIRIITSGKLVTPSEVAWALCAGADFINSARGFMFSLGCIQSLKCNKNTCPTGITTHNKRLQKGLNPQDKAVKVANYCLNLVHEVEVIAHSCGVNQPRGLRRKHIRIIQDNGRAPTMAELYPRPEILADYAHHVSEETSEERGGGFCA